MPLDSGTKLGPYEISVPLGAGGMGEVYRALDTRHDRAVAVKVLRQDVSTLVGVERFLREIRIAAQLTHPHILPLIDSGEAGGVLFYVMPYIEGETLRNRLLREGELPVSEIIRILHQITDALAYAHAHGVVHRDLKPENVLLSDRHALLADFGVAKALSDLSRSGLTATTNLVTAIGSTVGTPTYMAPEQVGGNMVDQRADLYGVGVVAYEMIGGRLPFQATSAQQMMAAHLTQAPDPITKWRPAISVRLANAVMKCLEKKAADRWQSAADLLAEIEVAGTEIKTAAPVETPNELTDHRFTLSERICRKLNRATLDPRVIGDHLSYVDNQVRSDVLVFFLPGLGLDHADFESILQRLRYRGVSPTLYGCEPERCGRISLSLADHVVILRELLKDVKERFHAETVVIVGYSMGADMGFELLLGSADEPTPRIDAFLSLECNLSLDTCFVSRLLAGIDPAHPELSIAKLRGLGDSAASLDEWLNVEEYLVKVLRKFQGDIGVLQRAAADIVRLFSETPGFEVFARWFCGARERVRALRVVFSSDPRTRAALARLKLDNLDKGILGGEFPGDMITVSKNVDHFKLMATEHVVRQVDELVTEARAVSD
jgi:tRNA A-37 threonylcarbamoyl transferase component Bud32/pimeloyl-ACP methyl ester carboxylesterase